MKSFEDFQRELEANAAQIISSNKTSWQPELTEVDLELLDICAGFNEAELLAAAEQAEEVSTAEDLRAKDKSQSDPLTHPTVFSRPIVAGSVDESYAQLAEISADLCEELQERHWDACNAFVGDFIVQMREAAESGRLAGLASYLVRGLDQLKSGCETFARTGMKTHNDEIGELFLLTALAAHELRQAMRLVYDC